ncbi:MAG TPA: EAL domain-containing protein [Geobacteraceae bacterium]|nr:EAL domain-containing protein [Geobacteraceae bacterium]
MHDTNNSKRRPSILIVDDDLFQRMAFQDALNGDGFVTATAADGASAVSSFMTLQPDLILLDLIMPGKDGLATCQEIRSFPSGKYLPILMVTGMDDATMIHRAFEAGATDFIVKPIKPELLIHRVRYILRASRSIKSLAESEEWLATAQSIAHLGNWELNPLTGMFRGSEEMFKIMGLEQESRFLSFENFLFAVYPLDRHMVASELAGAYKNRSTCCFEFRIKRPDAEIRTVRLQGHADAAAAGKIPRILGTLLDITEIRQVEDNLRMLKEAVDCLPIGITLSDLTGKIIYSNPVEAEMHGYTADELVNGEIGQFAPEGHREVFPPDQLNQLGMIKRESMNVKKSGEEFPVLLTSIAVRNTDGRCLGIVTTCEDISSRKEAEEKIHRLAYFDPLTGLPNRGMFLDRLRQALALAHREEHKVCLVFLDLDNFKDVNDTYGHDFGDKLLREVADRLAGSMRESDTLARLGGDEFVVIFTSVTCMESTAAAVQRLVSLFSMPFIIEGRKIYSSASIGIAIYPDDGPDMENLLKCADAAMYHAKNEGVSQYRFFSAEMNYKMTRRVTMENSLHQGMENEEFFLNYQPQWDLKTSRMVGVEVLLRWQSADFGLMPPSEFIELTENSGLIFDLGVWVLRKACIQAKNWSSAGYRDFRVAVNISGKQLKQPDFLEMVEKTLTETGMEPNVLELEFTESVIMEQADKTIDTLLAIKKMGIQLSIDNFGTGYSSLNYLRHFPIDRIKIDRSFVADLDRNNDDATLVETIISMGHTLNRKVLAEGVENGNQLYFLRALGCDEAQGFYLAMPMAADELTKKLGSLHGKKVARLPYTS